MLCYAVPTSHFPAHAFSRSPQSTTYTASSPYRCGPSSYLAPNDDEEEQYYEYLDAVRRQRERRELEQVQAERWARQEAARTQAQQEARRAAAYIEYQQYLQQQHQERFRAQAVAQAEAQAKAHAQAIAQARARAIAEYQAREHAKAIEAKKQQQQQQEQAMRRQIMDHIIRSILDAASTPDTPAPAQTVPAVSAPPAPPQASRPQFATKVSFASHVHIAQPQSDEESAVRTRLQQVEAISTRLEDARKAFVEPESLVFDSSATSPTPKLAYSPLNRPVQVLEETLTKLLIDLDTITSDGHQQVKTARKQLAVAIEEELTKLELIKSAIWMKQNKAAQEVDATHEGTTLEANPEETPTMVDQPIEGTVAVQLTHGEAEEKHAVHNGKEEAERAANTNSSEEQETSPPVAETKSSEEEEAGLTVDHISSTPLSDPAEKKEGLDSPATAQPQQDGPIESSSSTEVDDPSNSAPTSLAAAAPGPLSLSPSHTATTEDHSTDHTEIDMEPASTRLDLPESTESLSDNVSQPSSVPEASVTVTDDAEVKEQESAAYEDTSKTFEAESKEAQSETDARDQAAEDASSESSFEML